MDEKLMSICIDSSVCPPESRWEGVYTGGSVGTVPTKISKQTGHFESRSPFSGKYFNIVEIYYHARLHGFLMPLKPKGL
jgi:hypothetical protein